MGVPGLDGFQDWPKVNGYWGWVTVCESFTKSYMSLHVQNSLQSRVKETERHKVK